MLKRLFSKRLILLLMFALLNACGGSDEPSGLLADTGGNVGGDPPPQVDEFTDISVSLSAQQIIPSGGKTTINLTTYIADTDREGEIAPNVTLKITAHPQGAAKLENVPNATDSYGDAKFTVSHSGSGNVSINISGTGRFKKGFDIPLYFGATATANLDRSEVPADGQTSANLKVFVRDWAGTAIPTIPVNLSFPLHSFAVPTITSGNTDETGHFTTGITNTVAQVTKVTPIAGGFPTGSLTLTFGASAVVTAPEMIELITKSNNVLANGTTTATLIVIARDVSGMPVRNIPVSISSDSATALLSIEGKEPSSLFISGDTGESGSFELNITNTVEGEVNIVATTTSGDEDEKTTQTTVIFTSGASDSVAVAKIELDQPLNNGQLANGTDKVYLRGRVLDKDENPLSNQKVSIIIGGSSAEISAEIIETDNSGRFSVTFTDAFVEQFTAKAVIGDISSKSVIIKFIAIPIEGEVEVSVQSITLLASPNQQIANGEEQITLTAIVRDINGTPVSGVPVTIGSNSATAIFDKGADETGDGGTAIFKVHSMVSETFTVTVNTQGRAGTIRDSKTVSFVTATLDIATLDVTVVNNNQPANGEEAIKIDVVARDNHGSAISDVPIMVQMSAGTTAFANPSRENTDSNGFFTTNITSTQAGDITVTIAVEGISSVKQSKVITFIANSVIDTEVTPSSVDLKILNNGQPADGESKITLIATPRDASGTPLLGVDIEFIAESNNIETIPSGTTNALGEYRVMVTTQVAEKFKVTPVATKGSTIITGSAVFLTFIPVDSGTIAFQVINNNQLANGEAAITLLVIFKNASGNPIRDAEVKFIDDSPTVEISGGTTNALGEFRTTVKSTVPEKINVTPVVKDIVGEQKSLIFYADTGTIDFQVINNNQAADGESAITLVVTFKDASGNPIPDAEVKFIDDSPTVEISGGTTNALGEFRTIVKSTVPEKINVTPVVKDILGEQNSLTFYADTGTIDFQVINNNQAADGESAITLVVTFKDASGNPIPDAEVKFIDDSPTVEISGGTTNALGEFRTIVKSTVPEKINVTPVVKDILGEQKSLTFVPMGTAVKDLTVTVVNNNLQATGAETIQIDTVIRDNNGQPVKDAPLIVQLPAGSAAIANPSQGKSDENGYFTTNITSTVAGDVDVTIAVEGSAVDSQSKVVTFLAASAVTPTTIELQVLNAPQAADDVSAITLVAIPRDANNAPIAGVEVELISDSMTAQIAKTKDNTNALGEFRTTVTNSVVETFNVTPVVVGGIKGSPIPVTFTLIGEEVIELNVSLVENNKLANGQDGININVITRDKNGQTVSGVPIVLQFASGEVAIANPSHGNTDDNGVFNTTITSTEAGEIKVTVSIAGGVAAAPLSLHFLAAQTGVSVETVELIAKNAPQPADGQSTITLIVIPRDAKYAPVAGVNVELIKEATEFFDQIIIAQETGTTNALGEFSTTVKTTKDLTEILTKELVVNITPVVKADDKATIKGKATAIVFIPVVVAVLDKLTLNVINNNQETGEEITLTVLAQDDKGFPLGNVSVVLSIKSGDESDVTGSARFGANGFKGLTENTSGVFETTITNSQPGTFKVTASLLGKDGVPIFDSNTVDVTFKGAPTDVVKEVSSISLITNNPRLNSEGSSEGVVITAIVKNKDNNLVEGAVVSFSADSGEIQLIQIEGSSALPGVTDISGRAQARLTTIGNTDNRTITVTATVLTTSEIPPEKITIDVVGTTIAISGPQSVIQNDEATFIISLRDSNNNAVANQQLSVKSELKNTLNNNSADITVTTDVNGLAEITFLASNAGKDIIKVNKPGVPGIKEGTLVVTISDDLLTITPNSSDRCLSIDDSEDINNNRLLDSGEDINRNGRLDLGCEIPLNQDQFFQVSWKRAGEAVLDEDIMLSANRGVLSSEKVKMTKQDVPPLEIIPAEFSIRSDNAGTATITVRGNPSNGTTGPSQQFNVKFVATEAHSITVQANPAVIGVNPVDTDTERSEILAVVRDIDNNLVASERVNFILADVTGGRLTEGSVFTDDFGRANTTYIAGPSSSAANGVSVTAVVADTPAVSESVSFTVAEKDLFVILGSGNELIKEDGRIYKAFHSVLVTDSNGTPVNDAEVKLSIYPLRYATGPDAAGNMFECENEDKNRNGILDDGEDQNLYNEDVNRDGILDDGEDINNNGILDLALVQPNGRLDPGNVITVDNLTLKTGPQEGLTTPPGFAYFDVIYAIQFAGRVEAEIMARAKVAGSENSSTIPFIAVCSKEDADAEACPTFPNPFGAENSENCRIIN